LPCDLLNPLDHLPRGAIGPIAMNEKMIKVSTSMNFTFKAASETFHKPFHHEIPPVHTC
jgi:hypothetical protein